MNKGKIILIVAVLAAVVGGAVGYWMWNKPHTQVEDVKGTEVSVAELTNAFAADEVKANETYLNKAIVVKGAVTEIQDNQDGNLLVILEGSVQCTMRDKGVKAEVGKIVTVKGFCTGSSLFGVLLSNCIIKE